MLVIKRRIGQEFAIGEATVKVLSTGPKSVTLGIDAPLSVPVTRPDAPEKGPSVSAAEQKVGA